MANEFGSGNASLCLLTIFTIFLLFSPARPQSPSAQPQEQPKSGDPNQEILKISVGLLSKTKTRTND
jgi:hypothetical protein